MREKRAPQGMQSTHPTTELQPQPLHFYFLAALEFELRVSNLLGSSSTTSAMPAVLLFLVCFSDKV
jgi:hypothetical protein